MERQHLELVLIVQDDAKEVKLAQQIFIEISPSIMTVNQPLGEAAIVFLQKATKTVPQLILLDAGDKEKMPGIEFARQLRGIVTLATIPIVIMSDVPEAIVQAHAANLAAGFIVRPIEVVAMRKLLNDLRFTF